MRKQRRSDGPTKGGTHPAIAPQPRIPIPRRRRASETVFRTEHETGRPPDAHDHRRAATAAPKRRRRASETVFRTEHETGRSLRTHMTAAAAPRRTSNLPAPGVRKPVSYGTRHWTLSSVEEDCRRCTTAAAIHPPMRPQSCSARNERSDTYAYHPELKRPLNHGGRQSPISLSARST